MTKRLDRFRQSVTRIGLWRTLVRHADARLRRLVPYEVCRVETNYDEGYAWNIASGYQSRSVDDEQFHRALCPELADTDYRWAFARGDLCIASFHGSSIVGHSFYTRQPTAVNDGVEFAFPPQFVYGFASRTAPSHRGQRLEGSRWQVSQQEMQRLEGHNVPRIFYIDVFNFESLAANRRPGVNNRLAGYTGCIRVLGRWHTFSSPGCRRLGAGFRVAMPQSSGVTRDRM